MCLSRDRDRLDAGAKVGWRVRQREAQGSECRSAGGAAMRLENWTVYLSAGLLLSGVALLVCVGAFATESVQ